MGPMGPAPGWGSVWGGAEEEPSLAPLYQSRAQHRALFAAVTSPGRSNGEGRDWTPNHTVLGEFRRFFPPARCWAWEGSCWSCCSSAAPC